MSAPRAEGSTSGSPPADGDALDQQFDERGLSRLRAAVSAQVHRYGVTADVADAVMIVVGELSSNVVRHAGGRGRLRIWRAASSVLCQVSDEGRGIPDPDSAGRQEPPAGAVGGRGLWITRRLSSAVEITSKPGGTTVTARIG